MNLWFRRLSAAIQSDKSMKNIAEPWFKFLNTNTAQMDVQVTILGAAHTRRVLQRQQHKRWKEYEGGGDNKKIGALSTFAVSHSKSTSIITLNRYNFIPPSMLMSFPQELDKRLVNGCLLLSVIACYIWHMACSCKDKQKRKNGPVGGADGCAFPK